MNDTVDLLKKKKQKEKEVSRKKSEELLRWRFKDLDDFYNLFKSSAGHRDKSVHIPLSKNEMELVENFCELRGITLRSLLINSIYSGLVDIAGYELFPGAGTSVNKQEFFKMLEEE